VTGSGGRRSGGGGVDKVESRLRREMDDDPGRTYSVIVTFSQPVGDDVLDQLGLMPGSPVEALGQLTRDAIAALAARKDVTRIRASPEPQLY
jgi:hypothetical protein